MGFKMKGPKGIGLRLAQLYVLKNETRIPTYDIRPSLGVLKREY